MNENNKMKHLANEGTPHLQLPGPSTQQGNARFKIIAAVIVVMILGGGILLLQLPRCRWRYNYYFVTTNADWDLVGRSPYAPNGSVVTLRIPHISPKLELRYLILRASLVADCAACERRWYFTPHVGIELDSTGLPTRERLNPCDLLEIDPGEGAFLRSKPGAGSYSETPSLIARLRRIFCRPPELDVDDRKGDVRGAWIDPHTFVVTVRYVRKQQGKTKRTTVGKLSIRLLFE